MLIQHNIGRNDEPYNTKAPFEYQCDLSLPYGALPSMSVRSVRIQCNELTRPPVRLSAIEFIVGDDYYRLTFTDSAGQVVGYAPLHRYITGYCNVFITSANNVVLGHISYSPQASDALAAAADASGGHYSTGTNDFILLPQCHVASISKPGMAMRVDGKTHTGHVFIEPGIEMHAKFTDNTASAPYVLSMAEPYYEGTTITTNPALNGICKLQLDNGYFVDFTQVTTTVGNGPWWLGGVHLTVRSSDTSNLRVKTNGQATSITRARNE